MWAGWPMAGLSWMFYGTSLAVAGLWRGGKLLGLCARSLFRKLSRLF